MRLCPTQRHIEWRWPWRDGITWVRVRGAGRGRGRGRSRAVGLGLDVEGADVEALPHTEAYRVEVALARWDHLG